MIFSFYTILEVAGLLAECIRFLNMRGYLVNPFHTAPLHSFT
jgi:hypothetical protein